MTRLTVAMILGLSIACSGGSGRSAHPDDGATTKPIAPKPIDANAIDPKAIDPIADLHVCDAMIAAWTRLVDCAPNETSKGMLRDEIAGEQKLLGIVKTDVDREHEARNCARALVTATKDDPQPGCDLGVAPEVSQRAEELLAHGTIAPRTGDPALDAVLQKMEAARDKACACTTRACVRDASSDFDQASVGGPPYGFEHSPTAVRDAVSQIIDELGVCSSVMRTRQLP